MHYIYGVGSQMNKYEQFYVVERSQYMVGGAPCGIGLVVTWVNRQTDMNENITFQQTTYAGGNYLGSNCNQHETWDPPSLAPYPPTTFSQAVFK